MKIKYIPLILLVFILGCGVYKTYAGRYWIGDQSNAFMTHQATEEDNIKIENVVRGVARDFGFIEDEKLDWMADDCISFGHGSQIKSKYSNLPGYDSGVSLLFNKGPKPAVGIKDYYNNYETDFIKALKKELETRLSEVVDMRGVEFKRHWDLMD